ncbi:N-acetyltransferase [Mycoplasmoides pirum]|uniref:N-acetyltransferase n=1 Tax=Mycoplasmoides pirum TaxID=2122 RepID=UPI0004803171|nr:N-acetyltransferase [Mycoplasmoides pirum]
MNEIIVRDYLDKDFEEVKKLLNNIFRLNERNFPKQYINDFLTISAKKFISDSSIKKLAIMNNEVAGLAFFDNLIQTKLNNDSYIKKFNYMRSNLNNENEIYDFELQMAVIKNIDNLIDELKSNKMLQNIPELKLLSVNPKFKGRNIAKNLINYVCNKFNFKSFWLVTDSNCNWKYYEKQNYKLIKKKLILDAKNEPYKSYENELHEIMIFLCE